MSQLKDEINEKILKKTQTIIIYAIAVIILLVCGLLVFRPLYTKAMESMKESEKLEKTLSEYKKYDAAKETNKKSIEQYESNIKTMLSKYPKDIYPEDMIVVLTGLESQTGILFTDISIESNNYVSESNDKTSSSSASKSSSSASKSSSSSSSSSSSKSSNSSSSNTSANSSSSNSGSSNSSSSANSSSANSSSNSSNSNSKSNSSSNSSKNSTNSSANSSNSSSTAGSSKAVVATDQYALYATPVTCSFRVSYIGIKQLFTTLLSSPLKKNIESVDLDYDEESGYLIGNMVIDFYTLEYPNNPVNGHEMMPNVTRGTTNVFHSIR